MTPSAQILAILCHPDWSEIRLAVELGVTQPTVNRIKKGTRLPSYQLGQKIDGLYARLKRTKAVREAVV